MGFNLGRAIAAVGAFGNGYVDGVDEKEKREHEKKKREEEARGMKGISDYEKELAPLVTPREDGTMPEIDPVKFADMTRRYSMLAASNPYAAERLGPALQRQKQLGMAAHAKAYDGDLDTPEGALAYTRYMADGAALYGDYMTAEQASAYSKDLKALRDEGMQNALESLHNGDMEGANKTPRGELVRVEKGSFRLGGQDIPTNIGVYRDKEGSEFTVNAAERLFRGLSFDKQVTASKNEARQSETKRHNKASEGISGKRADESTRHNMATEGLAGQTLVEKKRSNMANEKNAAAKIAADGTGGGKKRSADRGDSKDARAVLDTALGITRDPAGRMMNRGKADMDLYADVAAIMDNAVRDGSRPGDAAAMAKNVMDRAIALKKTGTKNPVQAAYKQIQDEAKKASGESDLPDWTR